MEGIAAWTAWIACGLFAAAVVTDLRRRRIPNAVPLLLLGLFAVHAAAGEGRSPGPLWAHAAVGAVLLAAGVALYSSGRFGAGDAKLMAVAGLWIGPADLSFFLLGLAACAFALSAFALLPLAAARRTRSELPFALAIVPPTVAVMIPRALSHDIQYPLP